MTAHNFCESCVFTVQRLLSGDFLTFYLQLPPPPPDLRRQNRLFLFLSVRLEDVSACHGMPASDWCQSLKVTAGQSRGAVTSFEVLRRSSVL